MKFWGGPVWPNQASQADQNGVACYRHRGYYCLMLDLDNYASSGWNNHWSNGNYTSVGYYASKGLSNAEPIGVEMYFGLGMDTRYTPPKENGAYKNIDYFAIDASKYNGQTNTGSETDICGLTVSAPDSSKANQWQGNGPDVINNNKSMWAGHAFGYDWLEMGIDLTLIKAYWQGKNKDYFKVGDVIGISGYIQSPLDNWGSDVSSRGFMTVPTATAANADFNIKPDVFHLAQNYPNPFNPETNIPFAIGQREAVKIQIFDLKGRLVQTLLDQVVPTGEYQVKWNGRDEKGCRQASGIYLYKLTTLHKQLSGKMTLLQ